MVTVLLIIILIVARIVLRLPAVKGFIGEFAVRIVLNNLSKEEYVILNDIMIPIEGKTTQIDHIVISLYGIFVIETKNFKGWILGKEKDRQWTQVIFKRKERFQNPVHQNYGHIRALEDLLAGDYERELVSIISFGSRATLKDVQILSPNVKVINRTQLLGTIRSYQQPVLTQHELQKLVHTIETASVSKNKGAKKAHVQSIKSTQTQARESIKANKCPKCGGDLVNRKGKYGSFLGCSHYPSCRFVEKKAN